MVAGYSMGAVALVAFLTINGASGIPAAGTVGTAGLLVIGLLLSVVGMLQLRRGVGSTQRAARYGLALQGFGLVGLLFGVVLVVVIASLSGYLVSTRVRCDVGRLSDWGRGSPACPLRQWRIELEGSHVPCPRDGSSILWCRTDCSVEHSV